MKGGAKLDLGVYCIAPLVHLFGTPWGDNYTKESALKYIFTTDTMLSPGGYSESDREFDRKRAIDVQGSMIIQYPQMDALLSYSKAADSAIYCEIQGENGTLVIKKISTMDGPHLVMRAGVGDRGFVEGEAISIEDKEVKSISKDYDMYFEAREFMNLIENGLQQSTENSWDRSLEVVRICSIS
jgi:predicted dehydrogenase